MRDIKKCYKRLKKEEDTVEHGDVINHGGSTGFYLNGYSLHYMKYGSGISLSKNYDYRVGVKVWGDCSFRRVKP